MPELVLIAFVVLGIIAWVAWVAIWRWHERLSIEETKQLLDHQKRARDWRPPRD
jgi:hypothetical protein